MMPSCRAMQWAASTARWPLRARLAGLAACVALSLLPMAAWADPNDYVLTLDFAGGEHEFETKAGAATSARNGAAAGEAASFGWGTGVSDRWFTEVYAQFANSAPGGQGGGLDSVSWENIVRLSEPGQWPVDVGALVEIERPRAGSQGWKITAGPLFQRDVDQLQVNANFLLLRAFDGGPRLATQFTYQLQLRYRADKRLEWGMQALGEMGAWNHWGTQQGQAHRFGPALFGERRFPAAGTLQYNAAVLLGTSRGAADVTLRTQIEYDY
jgi:hypothetical protein